MSVRIHPTANIEENVSIGAGTSIWDNVHVRHDTTIGEQCIIGEKTHISYGVAIGNRVKINAFVYICTGIAIEDGVMISAGCLFTNDRYPRATDPTLQTLRTSDPDEHTLLTTVRAGATIGAGTIIGPGLTIGRFAMIGMGSVITRTVPDYALVAGHPARLTGYVCACGEPFIKFQADQVITEFSRQCGACGRWYEAKGGEVRERANTVPESLPVAFVPHSFDPSLPE